MGGGPGAGWVTCGSGSGGDAGNGSGDSIGCGEDAGGADSGATAGGIGVGGIGTVRDGADGVGGGAVQPKISNVITKSARIFCIGKVNPPYIKKMRIFKLFQ